MRCPCYIFDAKLQDDKKISKWKPRAQAGMFLGFSNLHLSLVGMVLNIRTGYISPQFHVVYDEKFETVMTNMLIDLSETWINLEKDSHNFYLDSWDRDVNGPLPTTGLEILIRNKMHIVVCSQKYKTI